MKCKECHKEFDVEFNNMMVFEYSTIFNCPHCHKGYMEEEVEDVQNELESE